MFDLRSFSLDEMYRCSADLREIGMASRNADDAAKRAVSYLFEAFRLSDTSAHECALVRLFRTQPLASLDAEDIAEVRRSVGGEAGSSTLCLSLRATRGVEPQWNEPASSRRHRLIPLTSPSAISNMPMVAGLLSQLGVPAALLSGSPCVCADRFPLFNVFHVEEAQRSPLVPDQSEFVEPYKVESVLGFGGTLPPSEVFVVILFATVRIPKSTAELFRTLAPSVGLALLAPERDLGSLETRIHSFELIVRHHEEAALSQHRQLEQIAEQLASSFAERQRFEALVENSSDFIGMATPDGRGIYLNPAGRRMVGLSPVFEVTRTRIHDYYTPEARLRLENEVIPNTLTKGRWAGETTLRHWETNAAIPVSDHHFIIRESKTNRLLGMGTVSRDISEKRRSDEERERLLSSAQEAKAEAQAASRAKDDFLASLGHELRNPLSPILTAVELMKLRGLRTREQEIIERQALHLARLVDDLLDVARIARGKIEVRKKPVEIAAVVGRAVEIVSPTLERRKQQLTVEVPQEGLLVNADIGRLAQVVSNLLDNASKYSHPGSRVVISADRTAERLHLRVRDHGIGIPNEMLGTIFESFVQHRQGSSLSAGLGLGLTIARNLAELHGGTVRALSEGPGKGSEFVVELPLVAIPTKQAPSVTGDGDVHPLAAEQTKRVLLVDDNADAASVLGDTLTQLGHEVLVARDGASALELAREFRPEVALLDIGMPVMDGYELARRLRQLPEMPGDLRIVAVSGYGEEGYLQRSVEAGFAAHLVKPVPLDALMDAVQR